MAYFSVKMFSNELRRQVSFEMYVPNDPRYDAPPAVQADTCEIKTLFLLHGYTGIAGSWIPEYLCEKYRVALVMPNGENSFWLDGEATGRKFCRFVGIELVDYIRKTFDLARGKDDTYILGYSMGGFGAIHTALRYPERFGKIGAMSSALIMHEVMRMQPGYQNGIANYDYYRECFGEPEKLSESENNPEYLVKQLKREGIALPEIYMCCGTEDFLLEENRSFHRFLEDQSVEHIYLESKGIHDMVFWMEYSEKILAWMYEQEQQT